MQQTPPQGINGAGVELTALDVRAGANAGFWLQLLHPVTREPIPARLQLLGADSDACHLKARALRRMRAQMLLERATDQDEYAAQLALVEAATVGWEGLKVDGQVYEYTPERVHELYQRWPWIVDLAESAIGNRRNFFSSSASS